MAGRRAIELAIGGEDLAALGAIARSRTEPASRVERARVLLVYREDPSFFKVGRAVGVHHQTAQRCVERALAFGPMAALDDRPRPGKEPTITVEAKAWVVDLACRKAKELGYPHELWTTRLLARHAREHGPAEGHTCLAKLAQGTLCNILNEQEIKPHKVRYSWNAASDIRHNLPMPGKTQKTCCVIDIYSIVLLHRLPTLAKIKVPGVGCSVG
jgi:hypothetical protein